MKCNNNDNARSNMQRSSTDSRVSA